MMTSSQVVETSVTVTDNSPFQDYAHPDDHTTRSTVTPGFKPFFISPGDIFKQWERNAPLVKADVPVGEERLHDEPKECLRRRLYLSRLLAIHTRP